jgi:hypothetical protein
LIDSIESKSNVILQPAVGSPRPSLLEARTTCKPVSEARREAADFEVLSPAMTNRSPSGSRTTRLSLRRGDHSEAVGHSAYQQNAPVPFCHPGS